jgi:hypothetical protein
VTAPQATTQTSPTWHSGVWFISIRVRPARTRTQIVGRMHGAGAVAVVMLTVGMNVVLHGVTAPWGTQRYGRWYTAAVARNPGIREASEAPQLTYRVRYPRPST